MKNWLFPRIDIQAPSKELAEAYSKIIRKDNPNSMLPYSVAIFLITVVASLLALSAVIFKIVFIAPPLLLVASNALLIKKDRLFWLGPILFILLLANFAITAGTLILFFPDPDSMLCCIVYYIFLFIFFVGIVLYYRKNYQDFEKIVMRRDANLARPRKPYSLFSSVVRTAFAIIVVKSVSYSIIGAGTIALINYFLCPIIAEQIIIVRQYGEMPKG